MKINIYEINELARSASRGDKSAEAKLREMNTKAVRQIRRRQQNEKKAGIVTPAMSALKTRNPNLSLGKKIPVEQLREQLLSANRFFNSETSTVRGFRKWEKNEMNRLKERGIELTTEEFRGPWRDFLNSDAFEEFKSFDSERALNEVWERIKKGGDIQTLQERWEQYTRGDIGFLEIFDDWEDVEE